MPATTYKGWALPTVGGSAGTWGTELNTSVFAAVDANLGGIYSLALAASNVTLTDAQTNNLILRLSGTLTASVVITLTPLAGPTRASGFWFVENGCTGAFTVSISNGVGTQAQVPQGCTSLVIAGDTIGCRTALSDAFPPGQTLVTAGTSAPAGWTKLTTHNNKALRLVNGAVSTGGATAFTSVFGSRNILIANLPAHSHTITDPGHTHPYTASLGAPYGLIGSGLSSGILSNTGPSFTGITINNTGSGTAMDFDIQYVDVTIITKNS